MVSCVSCRIFYRCRPGRDPFAGVCSVGPPYPKSGIFFRDLKIGPSELPETWHEAPNWGKNKKCRRRLVRVNIVC